MKPPVFYYRAITGSRDPLAVAMRGGLYGAALLYGGVVSLRNARFDRNPAATRRVSAPVISVGNLTTGGTGKTPLVMDVAARLQAAGRHPAVVSRGYKGTSDRDADELLLYRRRLPNVACIANPDRVAGARTAIETNHADVVVLDDGFQHRRIARDLDIVVIDATCPFGFGYLLPRGLLREPLTQLNRASLIVVSRADQVTESSLRSLDVTLDEYVPDTPRVRCIHRPTQLARLDGTTTNIGVEDVGRAFCFAAIGNPDAFHRTLGMMGIETAGVRWWPDHHRYTENDIQTLQSCARDVQATVLLTTEKDAVKLGDLSSRWHLPVYAVQIEIDFLGDGSTILSSAIDSALARWRHPHDTT